MASGCLEPKGVDMATSTAPKPYVVPEGAVAPQPETRSGWVLFAGIVLLVGGVANLFWGLAALDGKSYLDETGLLYNTLETWGWIAIGWSALLLIGSVLLLARTRIGPAVGIVLAAISCFFWLFTLPVMPLYAMTVILVDILVIYGLVTQRTE
jgi:hypothetical protein